MRVSKAEAELLVYIKKSRLTGKAIDWETEVARKYCVERGWSEDTFIRHPWKREPRLKKAKKCFLINGSKLGKVVRFKENGAVKKVVREILLDTDKEKVLKMYHDDVGHPGVTETLSALRQVYTAIQYDWIHNHIERCGCRTMNKILCRSKVDKMALNTGVKVCLCELNCSAKFTEDERVVLLQNTMRLTDPVERRVYLARLIEPREDGDLVDFHHLIDYFVEVFSRRVKVCKNAFCNLLGMNQRNHEIDLIIRDKRIFGTIVVTEMRGRYKGNKISEQMARQSITDHLVKFAKQCTQAFGSYSFCLTTNYLLCKLYREFLDVYDPEFMELCRTSALGCRPVLCKPLVQFSFFHKVIRELNLCTCKRCSNQAVRRRNLKPPAAVSAGVGAQLVSSRPVAVAAGTDLSLNGPVFLGMSPSAFPSFSSSSPPPPPQSLETKCEQNEVSDEPFGQTPFDVSQLQLADEFNIGPIDHCFVGSMDELPAPETPLNSMFSMPIDMMVTTTTTTTTTITTTTTTNNNNYNNYLEAVRAESVNLIPGMELNNFQVETLGCCLAGQLDANRPARIKSAPGYLSSADGALSFAQL